MLGHGKFTLVDECDMQELEHLKWRAHGGGYVTRSCGTFHNPRNEYLHRRILNVPEDLEVDHKNRNKGDNRRSNLRICTRHKNNGNLVRNSKNKSSRFKGVCRRTNRPGWQSSGGLNGKWIYLGTFATEEEAAVAYNAWAIQVFGEFARLNVP